MVIVHSRIYDSIHKVNRDIPDFGVPKTGNFTKALDEKGAKLGIRKSRAHELVALQKEILGQSMMVAGKLEMLQGVIKDTLEPLKEEGISIPFHLEETVKFYKLKVKMDNKISGSIYIPKALNFEPERVILVRAREE
jgi:hypothetical protein